MFRTLQPVVWAFDCEWVPCARSGRRLLGLHPDTPEADVARAMWAAAGATADRPRPFLPLAHCRVVSVAVVERRVDPSGGVALALCSLPRDREGGPPPEEADVLQPFLDGIAHRRPQLVGYHSHGADLPILRQRALALGLDARGFCAVPDRPWAGPDYAHPYNDWNVDLLRAVGGRGGATSPSLGDLAALAGIPAKSIGDGPLGGGDVADLWLAGRADDVRRYNECDAVTTYLLWLRAARVSGHFTPEAHAREEAHVERLLEAHAEAGAPHLAAFLERWRAEPDAPLRGPDDGPPPAS